MTDYLLVHGAGQGAWSWGKVWGFMTAPVEHPPRLYAYRPADKVFSIDLPGHGADSDGDTAAVLMDECVQSIVRAIDHHRLRNVVLVGHGFAGSLILQAAAQLPTPPKRVVLIAGIVPAAGKAMAAELPFVFRRGFQGISNIKSLLGRELNLPRGVIRRYLCNGIDPMALVQVIGYFGPLPVKVLKARTPADLECPCPVTYVVLTENRMLSPDAQRRMARRIPDVEVLELESCHQATLYKPKELSEMLLAYA